MVNIWRRVLINFRSVRDHTAPMGRIPAGVVCTGGQRIRVGACSIDLRPVTNHEFAIFLSSTGHETPPWMHQSGFDGHNQPVVGVTYEEACAYADWAGKRLPTEFEWLRAARGDQEWNHPWGDAPCDVGRCDYAAARRGYPDAVEPLRRPMGRGPFGHHDLLGSVWEWCDGSVLRGGFFGSNSPDLTTRLEERPLRRSSGYGFRCAR